MKVLAHVADKNVGTRELDYYLTQHFAKEIQKKYKVDVTENKRARVRVLQTCEKVKTLLSGNLTAPLNIENLMDIDVNIAGFTREEMEVACAEVFDRLRQLIKDGVKAAGLENSQINKVEVIGGGCRIPMYKKVVEESFEQAPNFTLNATESVARGCAITAAVYSPKFKVREFVVHEAPSRAVLLGYHSATTSAVSKVDFLGEKVNKVITILNKTDRYPKTLELTFDRTDEFDLYYFYDEEKSADLKEKKQPLLIGQSRIGTTTKDNNGKVKVEIKFHPSGLISIEQASTTEDYEVEVEVAVEKPSEEEGGAPTKEMVKEMQKRTRKIPLTSTPTCDILGHKSEVVVAAVKQEADMASRDSAIHRTKETKNALEGYIYDYRSNLSEGGSMAKYLTKADADKFIELANKYENWLYEDEYTLEEYQTRLAELHKIGDVALKRHRRADDIPYELKAHIRRITTIIMAAQELKGKKEWISDDELWEVNKECNKYIDEAEKQVRDFQAADAAQDATISAMSWDAKLKELQTTANVTFKKPEPKPEPVPEEEKKEGDDAPAAEGDAAKEEAEKKPEGPKVDNELD
eukprot:243442_1